MSDINVDDTPAGDETSPLGDGEYRSYGVGLSVEALGKPENADAAKAYDEFKAKQAELKEAEANHEALKQERNEMIRFLKEEHNIGFSAMAEVTETSSSNVLYLYERSKGLSAKEIKALSRASNAQRAELRASGQLGSSTSGRKQTPAEKAFRKRQREELKAFMLEERERLAQSGEDTSDVDAGLKALGVEQAEDDATPAEE